LKNENFEELKNKYKFFFELPKDKTKKTRILFFVVVAKFKNLKKASFFVASLKILKKHDFYFLKT